MNRAIIGLLVTVLCAGTATAQGFREGLEAAEAKIDVKEWEEALELLLPLQVSAEREEDLEALAEKLYEIGSGLAEEARFGPALRAYSATLEVLERRYGDRDHLHVAATLKNVACCLQSLGRADAALPQYEAAIAMLERLHGARDHPDVAETLSWLAICLRSLGRAGEALSHSEAALAMRRRLHGDRDHEDVAASQHGLAASLLSLGRVNEALPHYDAALAMWKRLYGDHDHPSVARGLNNGAGCLELLGRVVEALPRYEAAMAMTKRLYGDRDHPDVAGSVSNVAGCLASLGRAGEALPLVEAAMAMEKRLYGDRDHPDVAASFRRLDQCLGALGREGEALPWVQAAMAMDLRLHGDRDHPEVARDRNQVGFRLLTLGRAGEALPQFEAALEMRRRLYGDRDHPEVSVSLDNAGHCLQSLGRTAEALSQHAAAQAMRKRLYGDRDHPGVASGLNNVAFCLRSLGRGGEALLQSETALAMWRRLYGDRDHPDVATSLNNVAVCLHSLGRGHEALPQIEATLAMYERLHGDRDHPDVARSLNNIGTCLWSLDRAREALPQIEAALAMWKRVYGDRDHRQVATGLSSMAMCLSSLGREVEALPFAEHAAAMIERLRDDTQTSSELRQSLFEDLKAGGVFELLQRLALRLELNPEALHAAERSRGRELLDRVAQLSAPEAEAQRRARLRGDEAAATRLAALPEEIESARTESDRLLHELTKLVDIADDAAREQRHRGLLAQSNQGSTRLRRLLDERARLLADVLPVGAVCTPAEIQAALKQDELLLEYTVTEDTALLFVVAREGDVQAIELPTAFATVQRVLPAMLQGSSRAQIRGRDAQARTDVAAAIDTAGRGLFESLLPGPLWERVRGSRRVFVSAHRELHRIPFELLVTEVRDGRPVHWLDNGPPISYVPSGTMLQWLRQRSESARDDATSLDFLAVGDPRRLDVEPEVPEQGVFVVAVNDGGEGARVGLQPGDILTSYDGQPLADDKALRDARTKAEVAIEDGQREKSPIPVGVWRRGSARTVEVQPGLLGIQVGQGRARTAYEASLSSDARMERITRAGDLERISSLPPLLGARAETEAIEKVFVDRKAKTKRLIGADATEPAVFDLAAKAKYLHFATHGIAEEYAGQSLSMLVLSPPPHVLPGDDGFLTLGDLFNVWRGRLSSCRLVVLSACSTNVGMTLRDEAPQALPIGFLFAGVPAVISSLWAVDDASTKELMTDFYGRLLAGETDKLAAFTDAKKALRSKYADPFHWAPFLYLGAPE